MIFTSRQDWYNAWKCFWRWQFFWHYANSRKIVSMLIYLHYFYRGGNSWNPTFFMGGRHVAARMEAGSSTDNRVTVSMRKISDVRTLVIPLNGNRTHQMADPRDGKRVENYSTSPLHFDNRSLRIYYDKTVVYKG